MYDRVKVLSCAYEYLYFADWRDAISDVFVGRAEVIEEHENLHIGIVDGSIPLPRVIRFKYGIPAAKFHNKLTLRFSREGLFIRDDGICQYCLKPLDRKESTIDDVLPRSRGGKTDWDNCVISCHNCNNSKGNQTPLESGMNLLNLPRKPSNQSYVRNKR